MLLDSLSKQDLKVTTYCRRWYLDFLCKGLRRERNHNYSKAKYENASQRIL